MNKNPAIIIILSFLTPIFLGAILLLLPFAHHGELSFIDAFFTAASAITVTGLIVVDTAAQYSYFGKTIIMLLIQLGGLGFMTFTTVTLLMLGRPLSITDRLMMQNGFTTGNYRKIYPLIKRILLFTLSFELTGTVLLFFALPIKSMGERAFSALFHSVSAFCNAGFSTFPNNLESFPTSIPINFIFIALIVSGGIGFLVLNEIAHIIRKRISYSKLSLHSKLVINTTALLIALGTVLIFIFESRSETFLHRFITALFQSVATRTAGFNTINLSTYAKPVLFFICILMFIGASPGSTGGGIKTTSAASIFAYFKSHVLGKKRTELFFRSLPIKTVEKAFLVIILSSTLIILSIFFLMIFEPDISLKALAFESFSAFGTVGLSLGITSSLGAASKIVIMITMFIGRIGPSTLLLAMSRRESRATITYPEEDIMIG